MEIAEMTTKASEGLDTVQQHVEELGERTGEVLDGVRHETAAALGATVSARIQDVRGMLTNMGQVIGRHPTVFVFLAAGVGFLVGFSTRRNNSRTTLMDKPQHVSRENDQ